MPTVLGIAILGSGRVARARLRELHERFDTRVAVVASHDFNRAYELAFPIAAAATEDWEEAIARPDVDAVMVCSTNPHHARMAQAAIAAGKPVSVDYPLALTLTDAEQLVEQSRARGVVLHVEHIELLSAWFEAFRKALPRIGRVHHITWNNLSSRPAAPKTGRLTAHTASRCSSRPVCPAASSPAWDKSPGLKARKRFPMSRAPALGGVPRICASASAQKAVETSTMCSPGTRKQGRRPNYRPWASPAHSSDDNTGRCGTRTRMALLRPCRSCHAVVCLPTTSRRSSTPLPVAERRMSLSTMYLKLSVLPMPPNGR
ncbi:Gfo/Idh/MocA family oxidoreductase [Chloracidobacterium sp. A]|nr:Gfo/Idh/MocA family oxidoreductase [Chloracidobacterium sp. S]QUV89857.1 Gfo/Idh/MocA family oxidoreductase [Chloracidobacterium sp. A]